VAWIASSRGGFYATAWSWTALACFLVAAFALTLPRSVSLGRLDLLLLAAFGFYTAWTFASVIWSQSVPSTLDAGTRALAYLALVAAGLLLARANTSRHLLGGVLSGATLVCLYALGTRILPDRLGAFDSTAGDYRLSVPVTYWNGLGIFAVTALLLTLTFAVRGHGYGVRALAAAPLPLLAATTYFTFSRGAWLALAIGLLAAIAADRERIQLTAATALLALPAGAAVWLASRPPALRVQGSTLAAATDAGHRLLPWLLALALASAAAAAVARLAERRLPRTIRAPLRTAWLAVLALAVAGAIAAAWVEKGSPVHEARAAWRQFHQGPHETGTNVGSRLFDLSSNGRLRLWGAAWDSFRTKPLLGHGGGTFWETWAASPKRTFEAKDTHSLYMQTLSELGIVGLALLAVALLVPVAAALRVRGRLSAGALAAYCAWLVHGAFDWDWQLLGVSSVGVLAGAALVARTRADGFGVRASIRWPLTGVAVALAALSFCTVMANVSLARATASTAQGAAAVTDRYARRAARWNPWSSAAWALRAAAAQHRGDRAAVRTDLRAAVERDPHNWQLQLQLAFASSGPERAAAFAAARRLAPALVPKKLPPSA
jgi:O-Antigen ligase